MLRSSVFRVRFGSGLARRVAASRRTYEANLERLALNRSFTSTPRLSALRVSGIEGGPHNEGDSEALVKEEDATEKTEHAVISTFDLFSIGGLCLDRFTLCVSIYQPLGYFHNSRAE